MIKIYVSVMVMFTALAAFVCAEDVLIPRQQLIEDTRLLAHTVESVHPDPYLRGGGKIAFHRRFQETLCSIPDSGMAKGDYYYLIRPLLASVGDGHTAVNDPHTFDPYAPGGIPLYFEAAYEGLFVAAVLQAAHRDLLGALLVSVEGVSFETLVDRFRPLRGADNKYLLYRNLGTQGELWRGYSLRALVPEWQRTDSIRVGFRLTNGKTVERMLAIPDRIDYTSFISPQTAEPELLNVYMGTLQRTDFFYRFLDSAHQTCLLVIRDLSTYREAFEAWQHLGVSGKDDQARAVYQRYHGTPAPDDPPEVIGGLPSATVLFRSMTEEMKASGTRNLLIDLSQNGGGSSLLSNILVYFLYGTDKVLSLKGRTTEIKKYSPEYFDRFPVPSLAEINDSRPFGLTVNDYDLSADHAFGGYPGPAYVKREFEDVVAWMPTFEAEYISGKYSGYYLPDNVMVLCDAGTFSSAFWVMYYLKQAGAEIVGIPSAQAGNCFGDIIQFELPSSGLKYHVSRKYFELYPNDPERGEVLMPDHLMTYQAMAAYDFDPLALVLFARDLLEKR